MLVPNEQNSYSYHWNLFNESTLKNSVITSNYIRYLLFLYSLKCVYLQPRDVHRSISKMVKTVALQYYTYLKHPQNLGGRFGFCRLLTINHSLSALARLMEEGVSLGGASTPVILNPGIHCLIWWPMIVLYQWTAGIQQSCYPLW